MALFGTDGVRGVANADLTPELALALGRALGQRLGGGGAGLHPQAVVGRDSRLSGDMLQASLTAGLMAAGVDVVDVGVLPTPAVSYLTVHRQARLGLVVSASHNPVADNGIKVFGPDGRKLPPEEEGEIERYVGHPVEATSWPTGTGVGRRREEAAQARQAYLDHLRRHGPRRLEGWRLVVDSGHGAAAGILTSLLAELGAEVVALSDTPDGHRINVGCGATDPQVCAQAVRGTGAHLGLSLDGDADRLVAVDETGRVVDGDGLLAVLARWLKEQGQLRGNRVVATVMSNGGLERYLARLGVTVVRTPVGDRHVAAALAQEGLSLGGEQSGHILLPDLAPTGDGELTAVVLLRVLVESGQPLSWWLEGFERLPQRLVNIPLPPQARGAWRTPQVEEALARARDLLGPGGRLVVRPSGTEPILRLMAEGEREEVVQKALDTVRLAVSDP
jgi:phosphoglucosamine mutase